MRAEGWELRMAEALEPWRTNLYDFARASCLHFARDMIMAVRGPDVSSSVTCTVDLYNVTDAAQVASSAGAITLSTGSVTHQKSTALTLPTSVKRFRVRIKTSDGTRPVAAVARVVVKGA